MNAKQSDELWQDSGTFEDDAETAVGVSLFSSPEIPHLDTKAVFGSFEVLGRLAQGGMAEVYLAREKSEDGTTRHLVLKKVLPDLVDDELFVEMFEEEGKLTTRLFHKNVCHVYECGQIDGTPFLTLEWVFGKSFREMVRRAFQKGGMPVHMAVAVIAQIADALDYIHNAVGVGGKPLGIIHRDVTPHNFMVSWEGEVKLLDFGVAKTANTQTESGQLKGKFGYVSPEQLSDVPLDTRSDIFSLGVCLYEALTGQRLFKRKTPLETLEAVKFEKTASVRKLRPEVPEDLDRILLRMLAKHRDDRYQTAGELCDALRGHMDASSTRVSAADIAQFLNQIYEADEKLPLPKGGADLTGSFPTQSSTASRSLLAMGLDRPSKAPTTVAKVKAQAKAMYADSKTGESEEMPSLPSAYAGWQLKAFVAALVLSGTAAATYWFLHGG